jgi:hypothetical protein
VESPVILPERELQIDVKMMDGTVGSGRDTVVIQLSEEDLFYLRVAEEVLLREGYRIPATIVEAGIGVGVVEILHDDSVEGSVSEESTGESIMYNQCTCAMI